MHSWQTKSVGEFFCDSDENGNFLKITNLNEPASAQLRIDYEFEFGRKLEEGKTYNIQIDYKTDNDCTGYVNVHDEKYNAEDAYTLDNTAGQWKVSNHKFTRKAKPIRISLDCHGVGEGNHIMIRGVKIFEMK